MTALNLATLAGGVVVSNSGTNASPAALTTAFNFTATGTWITSGFTALISYAGQYITIAVDVSSNGTVWTPTYTANIGSDHSGVFTSESITYNFPSDINSAYLRISFQELPQVGDPSLMNIASLVILDYGEMPMPIGSGFCSNSGEFNINGHLYYGTTVSPGVPRENFPLTVFIKRCTTPNEQACAHACIPGNGPAGQGFNPYPNQTYTQCGIIEVSYSTTACDGSFMLSLSGCILGMTIVFGTWIPNPNFSCSAPNIYCSGSGSPFDPSFQYIPNPQTYKWFQACGGMLGEETEGSGTAVGVFPNGAGGSISNSVGGLSDACDPCLFDSITPDCVFCNCIGCQNTGADNAVYIASAGDGFTCPFCTCGAGAVAINIEGSYTLNLYVGCGSPYLYFYYTLDGMYYEVQGIYYDITDNCGNTLAYNSGGEVDTNFDWFQFATCTISNWTQNCSPPINTPFTGPAGGTLKISPGTTTPRLNIASQIYPTYDGLIPELCPENCPVLGIEIQAPCLGTVPDRLQVDLMHDNLAISWVHSGAGLMTSVNRSPSKKAKFSLIGNFETPYVVESTGADDIGMVFLPNESLYLTYLLSGSAKYRLNKQFGTTGQWGSIQTPNPLVARHSASGRSQEQSFRFRALGTQVANGVLEFSQCRDNQGVQWTTPVTVTTYASGPYCGGVCTDNSYVCLWTAAVNVPGHVAAGYIYSSTSHDGGLTWGPEVFIGFSGWCNGIVKLRQEVYLALVWGGYDGVHPATSVALTSHNLAQGWSNNMVFGTFPPWLQQPPVIATDGDRAYICWVTNDVPQYIMSEDGGHTFY
jgi:hypothetical protein